MSLVFTHASRTGTHNKDASMHCEYIIIPVAQVHSTDADACVNNCTHVSTAAKMKPRMAVAMCAMPLYNGFRQLATVAGAQNLPQHMGHVSSTRSAAPKKVIIQQAGEPRMRSNQHKHKKEAPIVPATQPHDAGSFQSGRKQPPSQQLTPPPAPALVPGPVITIVVVAGTAVAAWGAVVATTATGSAVAVTG
eukprot:INCI4115.1.p2 GENE.INCI4115.1~~INCI4115.1.p2  ORF type:complete len:192 (+),score=17.81 INCI4115.1:345-920(+)